MSQKTRILIALGALVALVAVVLGVDALQRAARRPVAAGEPTLVPGSIPIRVDGRLAGSFAPADLDRLPKVSFVDPAQGKPQEGWLLRDIIGLYVDGDELAPDSVVTVSSSSGDKSARLTWAEVRQPENYVLFDLSNRGTLKLASVLPALDDRDEWVQDADSIEIDNP